MNKESRQLLNFLKKQNQMLKDDIKQLKEIVKLNKEALQVTLNYKGEQDYEQCIPQLIKLLYDENSKLQNRIWELRNEIEAGMCKALISEQIAFASTQQQVLLTNELKEKLIKLRRELQSRQKKIIELTKVNIDYNKEKTGLSQHPLQLMRLVEYSDMNKVTKKLKDQIEKLNQQLDSRKDETERLKDGKEQLFKLNLILTKQLNELKLLTSCQTTKSNNEMSVERVELSNNDMTRYMKLQRKMVNEEENIYEDGEISDSNGEGNSSDEGSEGSDMEGMSSQEEYDDNENENDKNEGKDDVGGEDDEEGNKQQSKFNQSMQATTMNFSSSVDKSFAALGEKSKMNMTLNLGNLSLKKGFSMNKGQQSRAKFSIPKLQLTKAKQIQNLIVKKINNDQKKKKQSGTNPPIKQEKYKKLQQELDNLRKKLGNQIMEKLTIDRECNFMKKIITELEQRNVLLVERKIKQDEEEKYQKKRNNDLNDNIQTLLDICRDVTLNQRLRRVVLGKEQLVKLQNIDCCEV